MDCWTVRTLAKKLGISPATLYKYLPHPRDKLFEKEMEHVVTSFS